MEQSNTINPNHLRGIIILKEQEEDIRFAAAEQRVKALTKAK